MTSKNLIRETIEAIRPAEAPLVAAAVEQRWNSLTKPPGSLGRLEELVLRFAVIRNQPMPSLRRKAMYIFCGDHGVAEEGVSAYPSEVTRQMVLNFTRGGAAINVLCRRFGIHPVIVDAGVKGAGESGVLDRKVAPGTANFKKGPAMSLAQAEQALANGIQLAREASDACDLVGIGEMGIANTTSASALLCVFAGIRPEQAAGRGAGLDDEGIRRKIDVIRQALQLHNPDAADPVGVLAALGGFEIAAMTGFILGAAAMRLPVMVDGFIACSSVLPARMLCGAVQDYLFFSHRSAERGHACMLELLGARPILDLDLRLGEGSAAAIGISLLESAIDLYHGMATFAEAGVSDAQAR